MEIINVVSNVIKQSIDGGITKFIICPFGHRGMIVKDVLNHQYGIQEYLLLDNGLSQYNKNILPIKALKEINKENIVVLFASENEDILNELKKYIDEINIKKLVIKDKINHNCVGRFSYGSLVDEYNPLIESIGSFCSFAPGCCVVGNHLLDAVSAHEFLFEFTNCKELMREKEYSWLSLNKKVIIGNDVWLGQNVIITNGARIGNGVIAGAGSIITKDVPDYAVVVGNPARVIRYRFKAEQIASLNRIAWWDWPVEKIKNCYKDFYNVDLFIKKHEGLL